MPTITERVLALIVLVLVGPLLAALSLGIALGGQSPLFLQERVGYKGQLFRIFKFRTIPDGGWDKAEQQARGSFVARLRLAVFKRISAVLRATGLDELPQFGNILLGDMQLIGPRPLVYDDFIALPQPRLARCVVPPGITGLAQINGGQTLDPVSKLALDLYIIEHLSFRMVAKIVFRTVCRILGFTSAIAKASETDLTLAMRHMYLSHHQAIPVSVERNLERRVA
ncbi:MAG: sugar transferase [Rhodovulum sp.]